MSLLAGRDFCWRRLAAATAALACLVFADGAAAVPVEPPPHVTVTSLSCPTGAPVGQATECTAVVEDLSTPAIRITPRGEVVFTTSGQGAFLGTCGLSEVRRGESRCTISYVPEAAGRHLITASFPGRPGTETTPGFEPSEAASEIEATVVHATSTQLRCDPSSGGRTICTATVEDAPGAADVPSGKVEFSGGAGFFGERPTSFSDRARCTLVPTGEPGEASCQVAYTPTEVGDGLHQLRAGYEGDAGHFPSTGLTDFPVSLIMSLRCAPSRHPAIGASSRCTVTVEDVDVPSATPTGEIDFSSNGRGEFSSNACRLSSVSQDVARCAVDYRPTAIGNGFHEITAEYLGDAGHAPNQVVAGLAVGSIRYAAPGGTGSDPCADPEDPCSLFRAASTQAPGTTLEPGAEIVLAPGSYLSGDLGPNNQILTGPEVTVHGAAGAARPVIVLSTLAGGGRLVRVGPGSVLSDLEIRGNSEGPLEVDGGVVERVLVRSDSANAGTVVCNPLLGDVALLRDTACVATGTSATAVGGTTSEDAAKEVSLRNVTAVATGLNSVGLRFRAQGLAETLPEIEVDAVAVLAQGDRRDVVAEGFGGGEVAIELESSAYTEALNVTDQGGGSATVTPAGSDLNTTERPTLAADQVHQLQGSATINRGAVDEVSGTTDLDGQRRTIGPVPDIGADEFVGNSATATSLSCEPATLQVRSSTVCTAVVENEAGTETTPSGTVDFARDNEGGFAPGPSCELSGAGTTASCQVTYTAQAAGPHRLAVSYSGDDVHAESTGSFELNVPREQGDKLRTATTFECEPRAVQPGAPTTCTVTVRQIDTLNATAPTGTVGFESDGGGNFNTPQCDLVAISPVRAACEVAYAGTEPGIHQLKATYRESESHASSSRAFDLGVGDGVQHLTTTTLECDVEVTTPQPEEPPLCTATVTDISAEGATPPTGRFDLESDSPGTFSTGTCTPLSPSLVPGTASSTCGVTYSPTVVQSGVHELRAVYRSDDADHASSADRFDLEVREERDGGGDKRHTETTIECEPTGVRVGEPANCTALVRAIGPQGATAPTGSVLFETDSPGEFDSGECVLTPLPAPDIGTSVCRAAYTPTLVQSGTHTLAATYGSDGEHASSASPGFELDVSEEQDGGDDKRLTETALLCDPTPVEPGEPATCTARVHPIDSAGGTGPTGTVSFASDHPGDFSPATCQLDPVEGGPESTCQVAYSPLVVGAVSHRIEATYGSDAEFASSTGSSRVSVTELQDDGSEKQRTTTALECEPGSVEAGEPSACTARVRPVVEQGATVPTGTVSFETEDPGDFSPAECDLLPVPAPAIEASCEVDYTPIAVNSGVHDLQAIYGSDGRNASSFGGFELEVSEEQDGGGDKGVTTTALDCAPDSVRVGAPANCTATVRDLAPQDATAPTGAVSFESTDPGGFVPAECELAPAPAQGDDVSTCQVAYTPAVVNSGTHTLTAAYGSDGEHASSTSPGFELGVNEEQGGGGEKHRTTTALECEPDRVLSGEPSTCTATVRDVAPEGATVPTGSVSFETEDPGDLSLDRCDLEQAGPDSAACEVTYTPSAVQSGVHELKAAYGSDDQHASSTGSFGLEVAENQDGSQKRLTATTLLCAPNPVATGLASICVATVRDVDPQPATQPTGTVSFETEGRGDFDQLQCQLDPGPFPTGDAASCQVAYTPSAVQSGTHRLTATYGSDDTHASSTGGRDLMVREEQDGGGDKRLSITSLECEPTSVILTGSSVCTALVGDAGAAGRTVPTGTVQFESDGAGTFANPCSLGPTGPGIARCQTIYTPTEIGDSPHEVAAFYEGDATHATSFDSAPVTVNARGGGNATNAALACEPNRVALGGLATCTATVTDTGPNATPPTRAVLFASDSPGNFDRGGCQLEPLGPNRGSCKFTYRPSLVRSGTHRIAAAYEGDPGHEPSPLAFAQVTVTAVPDPPPPPPGPPQQQPPQQQPGPPQVTPPPPAAAAPNTILRKKPRKKTALRKARFVFAADQAGASFQCKLDRKPFKSCRSPWRKKVKPGRHTFQVRAVSAQGVADPSPAVFKWTVGGGKKR